MNSPVVFTSEQLTILNTLNQAYLSGSILTFNPSNTASADTEAELNTLSGIVTFAGDILNDGNVYYFSLLNNLVTPSTIINYSMKYEPAGSEVFSALSYACYDGSISFFVYCTGTGNAVGNKTFTFSILNP